MHFYLWLATEELEALWMKLVWLHVLLCCLDGTDFPSLVSSCAIDGRVAGLMVWFYWLGLQLRHVLVNCVECYTARLMYEHILNELASVQPGPENEYATYARCENMNDFVKLLKQLVQEEDIQETIYIVSDSCGNISWGFNRLNSSDCCTWDVLIQGWGED